MKKRLCQRKRCLFLGGMLAVLGVLVLLVPWALAAPAGQTDEPPPEPEVISPSDCQECHLDVKNHWQDSPHAHAFDDPYFQERWQGMGQPGECLVCHTTNYQPSTGEYDAEGISCVSCHGEVTTEHPPATVPIKADSEYCGTCHTTTLGEWHQTGHASSEIGCMDCHDPHSQGALFEVADDLCINCHQESMEKYLEDLHVQQGIGCVDCHALVIPPDPLPEDGIVPTGHTFNITPATCVACHTDALHAGFSLPGFEDGAKAGNGNGEEVEILTASLQGDTGGEQATEEGLSPEQQIQALEAALASQNVTLLFQGGIVGLVLGASTAWFVAQNIRASRREDQP